MFFTGIHTYFQVEPSSLSRCRRNGYLNREVAICHGKSMRCNSNNLPLNTRTAVPELHENVQEEIQPLWSRIWHICNTARPTWADEDGDKSSPHRKAQPLTGSTKPIKKATLTEVCRRVLKCYDILYSPFPYLPRER